MKNKDKLGFGIIGCGVISKWHAESVMLMDDACLVGASDKNEASAKAFAKEYNCKLFSNTDELLASEDIDIVCICLPSGLHAEYAIKAANAGKHFIVEKPMAITKAQIRGIIEACERNSVKGCVISQVRFSPTVKAVKKVIDEGVLGDIISVDLAMKYYRSPEYYKSSAWKGTWEMDGGGALMNQGVHGIDTVQYLAGPIRSVCGMCRTLMHDIEVEDTAALAVEFENGAIGTITGTTSVLPGYPRLIEISGTRGTVALTEDTLTRFDVEGVPVPTVENPTNQASSHNNPTSFPIDGHVMQIRDMIDAVKHDTRPLVDIYEGKRAVDVIFAAYEASESKKTVTVG